MILQSCDVQVLYLYDGGKSYNLSGLHFHTMCGQANWPAFLSIYYQL